MIVSNYFSNNPVMDESSKKISKEKKNTSKKPQVKSDEIQKVHKKRVKGQKDIRTLIKSKKNELLAYTKDFDLICKQSGIDVDPEQLQLAIALSNSLQDNKPTGNEIPNAEKALTCNQRRNKIKTTLQEYGFKAKTLSVKKPKKYRKHYKLVLVSNTEKQQRIADRYAQILINNARISKIHEETLSKKDNINSKLYKLTTNVSYDLIKNDEIFYINDLVPKSLNKKHIFKDWSKIPGRPISPKLERSDISFKSAECLQEELDSVLSGCIEIAQFIIKKNCRINSLKSKEVIDTSCTRIKIGYQDLTEITTFCENRTITDILIGPTAVLSNKDSMNMFAPTNRSCSPDLFDDEETIIMDSSQDKRLVHEEVFEKTMTVKEQNNFMELTNCIGIVNVDHNDFRDICVSQGSNKTRAKSNDFMDLTECVSKCSQNNLFSINTYKTANDSYKVIKENNLTEIMDSNQTSNFITNVKASASNNEISLDDTIIMTDEDYGNIGDKYSPVKPTRMENFTSDLKQNQNKTAHLEQDLEDNIDNNNCEKKCDQLDSVVNRQTIDNLPNWDSKDNIMFTKSNECLDKMDVTQSSSFEDYLSVENNVPSVKSIVHTESDSITNETSSCFRNLDYNNRENCGEEYTHGKSENCEDLEVMYLTQSYNSEKCLQKFSTEACVNNEYVNDTITQNREHCNSIVVVKNELKRLETENDFERMRKIVDYVDLCNVSPKQATNNSKNLITNAESIIEVETNTHNNKQSNVDVDIDCIFDNLIENISNSKLSISKSFDLYEKKYVSDGNTFNLFDKFAFKNESCDREMDLTQNYDCSSDSSSEKKLSNKLDNINGAVNNASYLTSGDSCEIVVEGESNNIGKNTRKWDNHTHNSFNRKKLSEKSMRENVVNLDRNREFYNISKGIYESEECSSVTPKWCAENNNTTNKNLANTSMEFKDVCDIQNKYIDLTQQSDSSEDTLCSPNIIEVPDDLGKRNNISIDYDEVCNETNLTRDRERTSLSEAHKFVENNKSGSKDEGVFESSQHSELLYLSDNDSNYCINKHVQDDSSVATKQEKFDIGGISIINEFLNRASLHRNSKLRCNSRANDEFNTTENEVESLENYKNNVELLDSNVNEESKSCKETKFVKNSSPLKSKSADNIFVAKTPKHNDYIIKTDQVTPMPNYESMTSPERDQELDKFGIKPLKRKRAIRILTHIYNQTHPLMEVMPDDERLSPSKLRRKNSVESFPRRVIASEMDSIVTKHGVQVSNHELEILEPNLSQKSSKPRKEMAKNSLKSPIKSSCKDNAFYGETTLIPDIRNIECAPEDWVFQKREKAKVHSCKVPLHIAFHNYVSCRKRLRDAILKYEPINIDDVHKGLVANGYRYNPKDLLKFMDRKCITVKTPDNSKNNKNT